jgi:hypothetical protein
MIVRPDGSLLCTYVVSGALKGRLGTYASGYWTWGSEVEIKESARGHAFWGNTQKVLGSYRPDKSSMLHVTSFDEGECWIKGGLG